jgi:hypothetical protein
LWQFSAQTAFRSLNVTFLKKGLVDTQVEYKPASTRPKTEGPLVEALLDFWLPDLSAAARKSILDSRLGAKPDPKITSLLQSEECEEVTAGLIDEEEADVFAAVRVKKKPKAASSSGSRATAEKPKAPTAAAAAASSSGAASSSSGAAAASSSGAPLALVAAAGRRAPVQGKTPQDVKLYMPPGPGRYLQLDEMRHFRWRVEMKAKADPPRVFSKCYAVGSLASSREAMLMCIRWAWAVEKDTTGAECPWDLSA